MTRHNIIEAAGLTKQYYRTSALHDVNVGIEQGRILAIMGPSGSGKSTLLHCLSGVITPDSGQIIYDGRDIAAMDDDRRTALRRSEFGFVFQFGQLVSELSALDNVVLPLFMNKLPRGEAYARAETWLKKLEIHRFMNRRPGELSGGQAQRVAIARAMVINPTILFADEPTGALDSLSSEKVMELFMELARENNTTVVMVTHEPRIAAYADHEIVVRDGKVRHGKKGR